VSRIGLEAREPPVLYHHDRAASRNAERTIGVNAMWVGVIGHGVLLPVCATLLQRLAILENGFVGAINIVFARLRLRDARNVIAFRPFTWERALCRPSSSRR
jgi:hypothetical protein